MTSVFMYVLSRGEIKKKLQLHLNSNAVELRMGGKTQSEPLGC